MAVLVIDVGSSSVRAMLFDKSAKPIPGAVAQHKHAFTSAAPGNQGGKSPKQHRQVVEACIDEILQHPAAAEIEVVGMATFAGNLLGQFSSGKAATLLYSYADTDTVEDVDLLRSQIDLTHTHQRTGTPHHTAYAPARLHQLHRLYPDLFEAINYWLDFATYCYWRWFKDGPVPVSYSMASWSGLLNREQLQWDETWLKLLDLSINDFHPLADYDQTQCGLRDDYAKRWPQLKDAPFCLAVGDGAAANIGSGAVNDDVIALTIGTTAALRKISTDSGLRVPDGLWAYRVTHDLHLIGGATSEGGNIFDWAKRVLNLDHDTENQLLSRRPGEHGLNFLPLLAGERSPGWQAHLSGAITGLTLNTTPLDILQAALEGVALRLGIIAQQLIGHQEITVMASGGALANSQVWCQMLANSFGQPIHLLQDSETTARGIAILALHAIQQCSLSEFPPTVQATIDPVTEHAAMMQGMVEKQLELYRFQQQT